MPPDASPLHDGIRSRAPSAAHRQALGEGRRPENRQRAIESADQHRAGARVRARLRPAASERVRGRARPVWRDLRHARHPRSERPDGAAFRHLRSGRGRLDQDRRRGPGDPRDGRRRATDAARRQSWRRSGQRCSSPSLHPEVQAFLAAPIASPAHVYGWICLVGNEGRTFTEDDEAPGHGAVGTGRPHLRERLFHAVAQKRAEELEHEILERKQAESAAAPRAGPGAAIPGHGRSHPARAGPGRADHAGQSQGLRPPGMDRARAARARLDRDVPAGPDAGRAQRRSSTTWSAEICPSSRTRC